MIRVGTSGWAGEGLFADEFIAAGTRILSYQGERISAEESARRRLAGNNYIFHLDFRGAIDGAGLENTARYINHSCDPNLIVQVRTRTPLLRAQHIYIHAYIIVHIYIYI